MHPDTSGIGRLQVSAVTRAAAQGPCSSAEGLLGATGAAPCRVCEVPCKHSPWQNSAQKASANNGIFRNEVYIQLSPD